MNKIKVLYIYRLAMASATVVLFNASSAFAVFADGTEMANSFTEFFQAIGKAALYGVFFGGIILVGAGLWNLASPNPRTSKGMAVISVAIGAAMCAATAIINITSGTMTGGEAAGLNELGIR